LRPRRHPRKFAKSEVVLRPKHRASPPPSPLRRFPLRRVSNPTRLPRLSPRRRHPSLLPPHDLATLRALHHSTEPGPPKRLHRSCALHRPQQEVAPISIGSKGGPFTLCSNIGRTAGTPQRKSVRCALRTSHHRWTSSSHSVAAISSNLRPAFSP